jgi:hypothetical protein
LFEPNDAFLSAVITLLHLVTVTLKLLMNFAVIGGLSMICRTQERAN